MARQAKPPEERRPPGAPKGHPKWGGRKKSVPNKRTEIKNMLAELIRDDAFRAEVGEMMREKVVAAPAPRSERKLATDVLDDLMHVFFGLTARFQSRLDVNGAETNPHADEEKFYACADAARKCAGDLAQYQSPKYRAIAVVVGPGRTDEPKTIDGEALPADPVEAARVYRAIVSGELPKTRH